LLALTKTITRIVIPLLIWIFTRFTYTSNEKQQNRQLWVINCKIFLSG
jgi:uncharacterized membrane protein